MNKLKCIFCNWTTEPYSHNVGGGYLEAFESAKDHIKKKHDFAHQKYGLKGQAIQECFTVVSKEQTSIDTHAKRTEEKQ